MSATPPVAEWTTTTPPRYVGINLALRARHHIERDQAHDRRRPLHPPVLPQRGMERPAAHVQEFNQHTAGAPSIRPRDSNQHWRSTALPLSAVDTP